MSTPQAGQTPWWRHLYVQVLCAIALGALLGALWPEHAVKFRPLGDGFIKLIKMMIAPIIFCTVVTGIASMENLKKVGRVGGKALLYFEVVSTIALLIGLVVINLWQPGAGFNADPATLDTKAVASYANTAKAQSTVDFILNIIPSTIVDAFAKGEILQVLLFAVLFGFALSIAGDSGRAVSRLIEQVSHGLFVVVGFIMKLAPIGAFGAMAFTIGTYGLGSLAKLAQLMGAFYLTCLIFILGVLGLIAGLTGFSILRFIVYIKEELLIVLGTSSSETVLPRMMAKMERLGCSKSVVGLVIPTGYSFNLDGTSIYLTMAALFIAQATNVSLSLGDQLGLLAVLMLTSKGAAAVTGGGFVTLAATLSATTGAAAVPVAGLALILGIDRFMSEARALTNLIGNGVATVVIARWENELDRGQLARAMSGDVETELESETRRKANGAAS